MTMDRLVLTKSVTVIGRSFLGYPARVMFSRHPDCLPGWWLNTKGIEGLASPRHFLTLSPENLVLGKNSIDLVAHPRAPAFEYAHGLGVIRLGRRFGWRAQIAEHLLALRFSGLDAVVLTVPEGCIPYDGCAASFWQAVKPHLQTAGALKFLRLPNVVIEDTKRGAKLSTRPYGHNPGLTFHAEIDYGDGLAGQLVMPWSLDAFETVATARTLGWPSSRQPLAKLARRFGWPHYDHVMWPSFQPSPEQLALEVQTILQHRILDLCGELAAAQPSGCLLGGHADSLCSGHRQGIKVVVEVHDKWHAYNRNYSRAA